MRDFQYVNASERNRWAFVRLSLESFAEFPSDSPITSIELANLLRMLCPDFPLELVENTALLCGESDEHPFHTFLDATLMRFYYAEFFVSRRRLCCGLSSVPWFLDASAKNQEPSVP